MKTGQGGAATTLAATSGTCTAHADFSFTYTPDDEVNMLWTNNSTCDVGMPVYIVLDTDMVAPDPSRRHYTDTTSGTDTAGLGDGATDVRGTWEMFNTVTWTLPPGYVWSVQQGTCTGGGTQTVTCTYNYAIPT